MNHRMAFAAIGFFLAGFGISAHGQTTEADHSAIWVTTIKEYAERWEVRLPQVVVDSVNTGREVQTRVPISERPRVVSMPRMMEEAERLGFHLMANYQTSWPIPGVPGPWNDLRRDERAMKIFYIGQRITGDSAVAHIRGEFLDWDGGEAFSPVMTYRYRRDGSTWVLASSNYETGGHRDLGVPMEWRHGTLVLVAPGQRQEAEEDAAIIEGIESGEDRIVLKGGRRVSDEEAGIAPFDFDHLLIDSMKVHSRESAIETYGVTGGTGVFLVFLKGNGI